MAASSATDSLLMRFNPPSRQKWQGLRILFSRQFVIKPNDACGKVVADPLDKSGHTFQGLFEIREAALYAVTEGEIKLIQFMFDPNADTVLIKNQLDQSFGLSFQGQQRELGPGGIMRLACGIWKVRSEQTGTFEMNILSRPGTGLRVVDASSLDERTAQASEARPGTKRSIRLPEPPQKVANRSSSTDMVSETRLLEYVNENAAYEAALKALGDWTGHEVWTDNGTRDMKQLENLLEFETGIRVSMRPLATRAFYLTSQPDAGHYSLEIRREVYSSETSRAWEVRFGRSLKDLMEGYIAKVPLATKDDEDLWDSGERWEREYSMLKALNNNPSFVQLEKADGRNLMFVLKSTGYTLLENRSFLSNVCSLSRETAVKHIQHLIKLLEFLHSNRVLHSSLKPDAFVVDSDGNLVLIDLGNVYEGEFYTDRQKMAPFYIAEESGGPYSSGRPADVWALAVTALWLLGAMPEPQLESREGKEQAHLIHRSRRSKEVLPTPWLHPPELDLMDLEKALPTLVPAPTEPDTMELDEDLDFEAESARHGRQGADYEGMQASADSKDSAERDHPYKGWYENLRGPILEDSERNARSVGCINPIEILIRDMLHGDPDTRITAKDLVKQLAAQHWD